MDLLAQRWASPFLMLDEFIRLNQLHDFLTEISTKIAEERTHQARWEFYLHKVFNEMSFSEYVAMCEEGNKKDSQAMTTQEISDVMSESRNILKSFQQ